MALGRDIVDQAAEGVLCARESLSDQSMDEFAFISALASKQPPYIDKREFLTIVR